jgi:hypothetical protein
LAFEREASPWECLLFLFFIRLSLCLCLSIDPFDLLLLPSVLPIFLNYCTISIIIWDFELQCTGVAFEEGNTRDQKNEY